MASEEWAVGPERRLNLDSGGLFEAQTWRRGSLFGQYQRLTRPCMMMAERANAVC